MRICYKPIVAACCGVFIWGCMVFAGGKRFDMCMNRKSNSKSILDTLPASTIIACARLCREHEKCKSANHNEQDNTCVLFCDNHSPLIRDVCDSLEADEGTDFFYEDYPCHFYMPYIDGACQCAEGYSGDFCQFPARDCKDQPSMVADRYIYIYPDICYGCKVRCFQQWLFIFKTPKGKYVKSANATWNMFKEGFGSDNIPNNEYWMGNENLHRLTSQFAKYRMQFRVVGVNRGSTANQYYNFVIDDEDHNYTVHYTAVTRDKWQPADNQLIDGRPFRTRDHNDDGCVSMYGAAFWYQEGCPFPSPFTGSYSFNGVMEDMINFWALVLRTN